MKGIRPIKKLGQHFLVDKKIITRIIEKAALNPQSPVLEIGPGRGALPLPLSKSVRHLFAVEKDPNLAKLLEERLSRDRIENATIFNEDILRWDFGKIGCKEDEKIQVVGNLPYNISSPFIEKLIENRRIIGRAILMFQQEVAHRLTASPSEKAYGALTLLVRYHALSRHLISVGKKAFYPVPKVDSVVIELDFEKPYHLRASNEDKFKKVVKGAFSHRRKTLLNSLTKSLEPQKDQAIIRRTLQQCGIDPTRRAETLDMEEFIHLSEALELTGSRTTDK